MKRLILVGGGHAHVEVLLRLSREPIAGTETILISPGRYTAYSGMLPGLIAGHYARRDAHIDLERLAHAARARFVRDVAVGLDPSRFAVFCAQGAEIAYDWLSIDVGSVPNTDPIRQSERFGFPVKPVDRLLAGVEALVQEARSRELDIAIVGAGAGGVELCFALDYRLRREGSAKRARFALLTETEVLPGYSGAVRKRVLRVLDERSIVLHAGHRVIGVGDLGIALDDGQRVTADRVIWVTGPAPAPWLQQSGVARDADGFVLVNDRLQTISHAQIFAAGDVATMVDHQRPKSGVYAVRQGPPLARNLRNAIQGKPLRPFRPQRRALQLITTGERYAIAAWDDLAFEGRWVWQWKNWIDRRFVARYA